MSHTGTQLMTPSMRDAVNAQENWECNLIHPLVTTGHNDFMAGTDTRYTATMLVTQSVQQGQYSKAKEAISSHLTSCPYHSSSLRLTLVDNWLHAMWQSFCLHVWLCYCLDYTIKMVLKRFHRYWIFVFHFIHVVMFFVSI